jgi:dihydroorotate dehydrogenase (fumarate)
VAGAVKIPVSVKLPMRLTNVFALSSALLGHGARGVVFFNRFFEPDVDVERMTFVESSPYSEPTELRNVLRMVAICSAVLPQLDLSVSTGVHDGEAAVKALLCGAEAVQVCTAIHQKGFEVIAEMNEYIDRWSERQGFGSLDEFRGRLNFKNDTSAMFQRVQYMKYFPSEAK